MLDVWIILLILFGVSLLISSIGFKKFVWFLSVGYGLSILGCGIALLIIYFVENNINITGLIACILLIVYGFRLGGFLLIRELKMTSYQKTLQEVTKTEKPIPMFVKVSIWIVCSLLYMGQASGVMFVLQSRIFTSFFDVTVLEIVGVSIMALGIFIEALADHQKSKSKKIDPSKPAMSGLYKICRCPNYYGEILMWTGVLVFFFTICTFAPWWMYVICILAYISIVYVMLNGAKRLEGRQL
ncbi:MAG: DUF1295 domain-containing protein, partial [Acholeplasmatales bacterium]|nr:DUF1295 domain-containing protein [Acholeplasmatales bacterium]